MPTTIALFRGINVGGRNKLPMQALRTIIEKHGYTAVQTYVQSGNVVFESEPDAAQEFAERVGEGIEKEHGFRPDIMVLSADELRAAVANNPFPEAEEAPKSLHFYFLAGVPPQPDLDALQAIKKDSEAFQLLDKVFYLHAPEGIGRSRLASRAEKLIGVPATARNWNTVRKLLAMAGD
jgi:uncharacterized protein (DUF1697 family)